MTCRVVPLGCGPRPDHRSMITQIAEIAEQSCLQQRFETETSVVSNHTVYHGCAAYEDSDANVAAPGEHDTRNLFRLWLTVEGWNRTDLFEWRHLRVATHGQGTTTLLVRPTLRIHHSAPLPQREQHVCEQRIAEKKESEIWIRQTKSIP